MNKFSYLMLLIAIGFTQPDPQIGDECIADNGEPGYVDCEGNCVPFAYWEYWLGNGFCDVAWGLSFDCSEWGYDCGDCVPYVEWDGPDPFGLGFCSEDCTITGDVNNDGEVNVLDILTVVDCILEEECSLLCSDLNEDGVTNILDIIIIVHLILFNSDNVQLELTGISPTSELTVKDTWGQESAEVTVEVFGETGNVIIQEFRYVFSIPCPYPIDGPFCPQGDGDLSDDLNINGIIPDMLNPQFPTDTVITDNGTATITINSGNKPGAVPLKVELFNILDENYSNPISVIEEIPLYISAGPPAYGIIGYAPTDAQIAGAGLYEMPISCAIWDIWSNSITDSAAVWFTIDPPEMGMFTGDAYTLNANPQTGHSYPGVAWSSIHWSSSQIFESPVISCHVMSVDSFGNEFELTASSDNNIVDFVFPCEGCYLEIEALSPTEKDFCDDQLPLEVAFSGLLTDAYYEPIPGGLVQMLVYDAISFNHLQESSLITDENGYALWVVEFPVDNCMNTIPEYPDAYECAEPVVNSLLVDYNGASSNIIIINLTRSCGE